MFYIINSGEENGNPLRILACKIPWTEEPGRLGPWGRKELGKTEQLTQNYRILDIKIKILDLTTAIFQQKFLFLVLFSKVGCLISQTRKREWLLTFDSVR